MEQTVLGEDFEKEEISIEKTKETKKVSKPKKTKRIKKNKSDDQLREIPISEFFEKNRHILGFDNPAHSLITSVKEGVDNSLDACEQASILPEIIVKINKLEGDELKISIEDNGPGIIEKEIPNVFGRLLYGSRFGSGKQSRGQQGIGISAAIMYGQLTTGRSAEVISKVESEECATKITMKLDIRKNRGIVDNTLTKKIVWRNEDEIDEFGVSKEKISGTKIEFALKGKYREGRPSVFEYIKSTAIVNPHATVIFYDPSGNKTEFERISDEKPEVPKTSMKPHPKGVELGQLMRMAHETDSNRMVEFLKNDFSVIFRPHIEHYKRSRNKISEIAKQFKTNNNFEINNSSNDFRYLEQSEMLVTDYSGIAIEYLFCLKRPVLYLDDYKKIHNKNFHMLDLPTFENEVREKFGFVINSLSLDDFLNEHEKKINEFYANRNQLEKFIHQKFYNVGKVAENLYKSLI